MEARAFKWKEGNAACCLDEILDDKLDTSSIFFPTNELSGGVHVSLSQKSILSDISKFNMVCINVSKYV